MEWNAFDVKCPGGGWSQFPVKGRITVKNTLDSYKTMDKPGFIKTEGARLWDLIQSGEWWNRPEVELGRGLRSSSLH